MYEEINKKHEIIIDASDKLNQIVLDLTLFENPDAWTAQLRHESSEEVSIPVKAYVETFLAIPISCSCTTL